MNGYDRIKAAFEGRRADSTPIMLHNFLMAAHEAGFSQQEYRNDPRKIAESFIRSVETYKYDGIYIDVDTATLAGAVGVPVDFPVNEPARVHEGCLSKLEDVKTLKKVDISEYKYVQIWVEAVRILKDYFKDEIYIRGNCDQAPFSLASMMRTPQEWMMDLYFEENQEIAFRLLEYCTDVTKQFIRLMSDAGAHGVSNGDSTAGPAMISPDMYEKFALPYEKQVVDEAHRCGVYYTLHICGDTTLILDKMVQSGTDAIELDYLTDIKKAHDIFKDKIVFSGNIDPSGVLALGSVNDVITTTKALLSVYSDTPKFILCSGCAIPSIAPSENIQAFIETGRNF